MNFNEYQDFTATTRVYPETAKVVYAALGLNGEAGECAEHAKKMLRDDDGKLTPERRAALAKEMGDVLWYLAALAADTGFRLDEIATINVDKLTRRKAEGKIGGSGSDR